jgi:hypothetical protein
LPRQLGLRYMAFVPVPVFCGLEEPANMHLEVAEPVPSILDPRALKELRCRHELLCHATMVLVVASAFTNEIQVIEPTVVKNGAPRRGVREIRRTR